MFTLKFYRSNGGYEIHQGNTVDVRPWTGDNSEGYPEPTHEVLFEDPVANALVQKLIGNDQFEHYEKVIVENAAGKTTEVIRG